MNRIFKSRWDDERNCAVVMDELAGSGHEGGKAKRSEAKRSFAARRSTLTLAVGATLLSAALGAQAADKLIGGVDATQTEFTAGTDTETTITVSDDTTTYDEVIGGHHVKQITNEGADADNLVDVDLTSSSVTVTDINGVQYVVGGSKSNNSFAALTTGTTTVRIDDGTFGSGGTADQGVIGGNLLKATAGQRGTTATSETTKTSVTINDGIFGKNFQIVGGSKTNTYGTTTGVSLTSHDASTSLTINGGDFTNGNGIYGGAVADGTGAVSTVGTSSLTLTGGTFNGDTRYIVYGGSAALNGGTASTTQSSVSISGTNFVVESSGSNTPDDEHRLFITVIGGGLNAPTTERSEVTIEDAVLGYVTTGGKVKKVQIYGGSQYAAAGTYVDGTVGMSITNSEILGDIRGGSMVYFSSTTADVHVTTGASRIDLDGVVLNGYTRGVSTWNGRVFGTGVLEHTNNSTYTATSTHIVANNITGTDSEQGDGTVTHDPGAQIFGGGQIYNYSNDFNNTLTVNSSTVELTGADSEVLDVIGGSVISGTTANGTNVVKLGASSVTVTDALVTNRVAGGNDVNWFGKGEVNGNTSVTLQGGARAGFVIGANSATFNGAYMFGHGVRKASMTGDATIKLSGSSQAGLVIGAGYAESSSGSPIIGDGTTTGRTEQDLNNAAISTMTGDTSITVEGNASVGILAGAGNAWSDTRYFIDNALKQTQVADATLTGNASSTMTGGSVTLWAIGGYAQGFGNASVTGNVEGLMTGGTATTVVVGGLAGVETTADLNYDSSSKKASTLATSTSAGTAAVSGDASFTAEGGTLGTVWLGSAEYGSDQTLTAAADASKVSGVASLTITGDTNLTNARVVRGAAATTELVFGTTETAWNGTFSNFEGIDQLAVAGGSSLTLNALTVDQMGSTGLTLSGDGHVTVNTVNHASKTLTIAGGTLEAGSLAMTATGNVTLAGGTLSTSSGQLFTTALDADATATDAGSLKLTDTQLTLKSGSLAVNDGNYNIHYASSAAGLVGQNVSVVFTGNLVNRDETDDSLNRLTADDYKGGDIADNVVFANAVLDNSGKTTAPNLVIGSSSDANTTAIGQSVGVQSIDLCDSAESVTVTSGHQLTLVGDGGDLITGGSENLHVDVGTEGSVGTLRLGSSAVETSGGTLDAALNVQNAGSSVVVEAGSFTVTGEVANEGHIVVEDGAELVLEDKLTLNNGTIEVRGTAQIDNVALNEGASGLITVGTDSTSGEVRFTGTTLDGAVVFLDPAWRESGGDRIEDASKSYWAHDSVDGAFIAGRNSVAVFGTDDFGTVSTLFGLGGFTWGPNDITAAAYIGKPISLTSTGRIIVNGALTEAPSELTEAVTFAANSLLIADVSELTADKALITTTSGAKATVDETASLLLTGLSKDGSYKIINVDGAVWSAANIRSANAMFTNPSVDASTGAITFEMQSADTIYGRLMQGGALADAAMANGATAAGRYANALLEDLSGDVAAAARRFDAAMSPAGALGVMSTALERSGDLRGAVREAAGGGTGLWVRAFGGRTDVDGRETGAQSLHLTTDFGGIVLGAEAAVSDTTLGAAFSAATGSTRSDDVSAKDSFRSYGLSLYGKRAFGAFNVEADLSVVRLGSDITLRGVMDESLDVDTTVWGAGVGVERSWTFGSVAATPFVGVDLLHLQSDGFTTKHGVRVDDADATRVEVPLGAKLSGGFTSASGLRMTPAVTLALVPAFGDKDYDQRSHFAWASADYAYTYADDVSVRGRFSFTAEREDMRLGLGLGGAWGNEDGRSANMNVRFDFLF